MTDNAKQDQRENGVGSMSGSALRFPRPGDEWEFQMPGKAKKRKIVDRISFEWHRGEWDEETCKWTMKRLPRVCWRRRAKGRHTSLRVKWLLKNGRFLSTEAERDAALEARWAKLDEQNT